MIRIFKNKDVKLVTNGAYNQFYKPLGYQQVIEVKEEQPIKKESSIKKEKTVSDNKKQTKVSSVKKTKTEE